MATFNGCVSSPSLLDLSRKTEYRRGRSPPPQIKERLYYESIMSKAFKHLAAVATATATRQQQGGSGGTSPLSAKHEDDATSFSFLPMEVIGDDINLVGKHSKQRSDILLLSLPRQQQQKKNIMQQQLEQQEKEQGSHRGGGCSSSSNAASSSSQILPRLGKSSNNNRSSRQEILVDSTSLTPTPRMRNSAASFSGSSRHSRRQKSSNKNGVADGLMKQHQEEGEDEEEEEEIYVVRQHYGYCSTAFSIVQTIILGVMMWQCGIAPLNINPMVGPYPDALSEWGGKNSILILDGEWWRLVTPIFLHAGIIHLICNVAVQLDTGCFFEKEWGSIRWMIIYLSSAVGSSALSVIAMPNAISVGSSGAVMGLFGGKLAEVVMRACEHTRTKHEEVGKQVRSEQCVGVTLSVAVVMAFSFIPYVDWAAHLGGLVAGLVVGIMVFACDLQLVCCKLFWLIAGSLVSLVSFVVLLTHMYSGDIEVAEELRDVCGYYQQYFEDYECKCMKDEYLNGGGGGGGGGRD